MLAAGNALGAQLRSCLCCPRRIAWAHNSPCKIPLCLMGFVNAGMHLWLRHLWPSKCWGQESCPTLHCVFLRGHSRDWLLVQSLFPRMRYEVPVWHCDILFDNSQTIFLSFSDVIINSMSKIKGLQLKASILFSCHISWWMWSSHSTIAIENKIYLNTFSW